MLLIHLSTKQASSFGFCRISYIENALSQALWLLSVLLVFKRLRQEDCKDFKASFGYIVDSTLQNETVSQGEEGEGEERKDLSRIIVIYCSYCFLISFSRSTLTLKLSLLF